MTKYRTKESENENETRTNNFDNTDGYVCVCVQDSTNQLKNKLFHLK